MKNLKKHLNFVVLSAAVLCFIGGVAFMAAGIMYSRDNTEEMGVTVLYAKQRMPAGTVLASENVDDYIGVKTVKGIDAVPSAMSLNSANRTSFLGAVIKVFSPKEQIVPDEVLKAFIGMQAMTSISENVQLEAKHFSKDDTAPDERLFSIPMDYNLGLGGEIQVGDMVDLWVYEDKTAVKIYSDARVFKLKGENNIDITPDVNIKPVLAIFKLTEEAIAVIRRAQGDGTVFLVKHGVQT